MGKIVNISSSNKEEKLKEIADSLKNLKDALEDASDIIEDTLED